MKTHSIMDGRSPKIRILPFSSNDGRSKHHGKDYICLHVEKRPQLFSLPLFPPPPILLFTMLSDQRNVSKENPNKHRTRICPLSKNAVGDGRCYNSHEPILTPTVTGRCCTHRTRNRGCRLSHGS